MRAPFLWFGRKALAALVVEMVLAAVAAPVDALGDHGGRTRRGSGASYGMVDHVRPVDSCRIEHVDEILRRDAAACDQLSAASAAARASGAAQVFS